MTNQRISVITGASKGIGFATAKRLNLMGHRVIGLARRTPEKSFPGEFMEVDLSDRAATEKIANNISSSYEVTHVINNVGLVRSEAVGEVDLDGLNAVLDLNLRPAVQLTQAFLPSMKEKGFGRIINISSLVVLGLPLRTSYAAAKAGLIAMTRFGYKIYQTLRGHEPIPAARFALAFRKSVEGLLNGKVFRVL